MNANLVASRDVLTREEAEARAARVSHVEYDVALELRAGAPAYRGDVRVSFQFRGTGDAFLDFRGGRIEALIVNGQHVEPARPTPYRLALPGGLLQPHNAVRIVYENEYDHGGDGFHQFVDPEDGAEYLYTNFEPYSAHRLMPCFDQPDLKATYALRVTAPPEWELIGNGQERTVERLDDGRILHRFAKTEPFSTYLFALIAGPYHVVTDEHRGMPLRFFCRKSLVPHLDSDELFEVTRQGMDFYTSFFDYSYPFGKYDQVFVPEFNAGAMENVAAVTHSERLVFRDPPTDNQRLGRAEVILHEMAHMWFGNLVTMRWWNDLWLNESFATYMAYLSMAEATRFKASWLAFNSGMKAWAYRQDQLVTTHPISSEVADTDETFLNFDGITYGKGAAVIKQLVATVGIRGFRRGMRLYFRRHAFGNTTLADFLGAIAEGCGQDLREWARLWLETPSLNTVAARWERSNGALARLEIAQTAPPEYPYLRPHTMEVALLRDADRDDPAVDVVAVKIEGGTTPVEAASGMPAPLMVMPNHNDHAFVKVALDDVSVRYVRDHLERVSDPLLRQLIWQALWNMVRDQHLRSTDYLPLLEAKAVLERDTELVETTLASALATIARFVPDGRREAEASRFSRVARQALRDAPQGDLQIIWMRTLLGAAITIEDIEEATRLVDGEVTVPGLTIDQEMRWDLAARRAAYGFEDARARIAAEQARDPSDRGQRSALHAEVSFPDPAVKAESWRRFHEEGYGSLHLTSAAMSGFHWNVQRDLLQPYAAEFFTRVTGVFEARDNEFSSSYFGNLFPGYRVEDATLKRSAVLLEEVSERLPTLTRRLREANDDLERAMKCRAFALT
jgi:aminopeptidase N